MLNIILLGQDFLVITVLTIIVFPITFNIIIVVSNILNIVPVTPNHAIYFHQLLDSICY